MTVYSKHDIDMTAADDDNVVANSSYSAGSLTLVGSASSISLGGLRQIVATTAADETSAGNVMTVTGTAMGISVSESLTLPNASTVTSTKYFDTITDVSISEDTAGNLKLGTNQVLVSEWIRLGTYRADFAVGFGVEVSGTIDYDVEYTMSKDDLDLSNAPSMAFDHALVAAETSSQSGNFTIPVLAMRFRTNSFTSGATASIHIIENGK